MKWKDDLKYDIRTHTKKDNIDDCVTYGTPYVEKLKIPNPYQEFSQCNHENLTKAINSCGVVPRYFLEIGVNRNGSKSSTQTIFRSLPPDGIYLGVDLDDRSYLNDQSRGIYTIKTNSSNFDLVISTLKQLNVPFLDFILIDGWHSINQVLDDWEYTRFLAPHGVVAFHDTTSHPGPNAFINALNTDKWEVIANTCINDFGFGYCYLKR